MQLYRDSDVVAAPLVPCNYAAGVTTLMEAMACDRPVVATRTTGLSDYLTPPDAVSVVEPFDATAMRAAIVRLLEDPEEARSRARRGHEFAIERLRLRPACRDPGAAARGRLTWRRSGGVSS